ncbi:hypothetical protein [Caldisericum sp. AR60]
MFKSEIKLGPYIMYVIKKVIEVKTKATAKHEVKILNVCFIIKMYYNSNG